MLRLVRAQPVQRVAYLSSRPAAAARGATATQQEWKHTSKRKAPPPPGWDPGLVDRMVKSSAADLITGKESDIGHEGLLTVRAGASLEEVSKIMWKKRIGVVLVTEDNSPDLAGIISERDFVKALATSTTSTSLVRDLMTPKKKLVTVDLDTGIGECMELMRKNQIRHLPVMARGSGVEGKEALKSIRAAAEARVGAADRELQAYGPKLLDALGDDGLALLGKVRAAPTDFKDDQRPLVRRAAEAAVKLQQAGDKLGQMNTDSQAADGASKGFPVGIISIRDLLLSVTATQMLPLMEWLDDERRTLVEERVGYSE